MRPAIEVAADVVSHNQPGRVLQGIAVIEADRAEVVAEIVAELRDLDGRRDESNLIGWAANHIEAKFGGRDETR